MPLLNGAFELYHKIWHGALSDWPLDLVLEMRRSFRPVLFSNAIFFCLSEDYFKNKDMTRGRRYFIIPCAIRSLIKTKGEAPAVNRHNT